MYTRTLAALLETPSAAVTEQVNKEEPGASDQHTSNVLRMIRVIKLFIRCLFTAKDTCISHERSLLSLELPQVPVYVANSLLLNRAQSCHDPLQGQYHKHVYQ